ncbi:MAG: stress response translation initiation inhibitor YciH [Euryarchaeota archaeon]|nr:stress response translation initiation inhibitor YciH [Euryarchaeota archaeon]
MAKKQKKTSPILGLPEDIFEFEKISIETMEVKIYTDKRKYGKIVTIVEGIDEKAVDAEALLKELKTKCACGGTLKDGKIILQGDHKDRVQKILEEKGFIIRSS